MVVIYNGSDMSVCVGVCVWEGGVGKPSWSTILIYVKVYAPHHHKLEIHHDNQSLLSSGGNNYVLNDLINVL